MIRQKVLFICIHNSARSQMAEELLRKMAGDRFEAASAGLEPGVVNPLVVKALAEEGIDISGKETVSAFDLLKEGKFFTYVVTVCDEASAESCPIFPGTRERIHWGFPDPSTFTGSDEEKLERIREIRDAIKKRISDWVAEIDAGEKLKAV
jgi:arsenate reductase